jgi:hypothetical protein
MSKKQEQQDVPQLPPQLRGKLDEMEKSRKKVLKDPNFARADQLKVFVGTVLMPQVSDFLETLSLAFMDAYGLSVSNANQMRRLHGWVVEEMNRLGADVGDPELPGVSSEVIDELQQAFFALGQLLEKKLPNDEETETAYNRCAKMMSELVAELMGDDYGDEEDDEDEGDDEPDDDGESGEATEGEAGDEESEPTESE